MAGLVRAQKFKLCEEEDWKQAYHARKSDSATEDWEREG
jgi:hypothetical protein